MNMENSFAPISRHPTWLWLIVWTSCSCKFFFIAIRFGCNLCACGCEREPCVWVYLFVCICILRVCDVFVLNFALTANLPEVRYTAATPPTTTSTTNYYRLLQNSVQSDAMAVAEKASFQFDTDSVWLKFVSLQFLERSALSVVLCVRAHRRTIYRFHLTNVHKTGAHQRRWQWLKTQTYANIFVQRGAAKPIQRTIISVHACDCLFSTTY